MIFCRQLDNSLNWHPLTSLQPVLLREHGCNWTRKLELLAGLPGGAYVKQNNKWLSFQFRTIELIVAREGVLRPTGRAIKGHWSPALAKRWKWKPLLLLWSIRGGMAAVATGPAENPPTGKLFPGTVPFLSIEKFKSPASGRGNTIQTGACLLNILVLSQAGGKQKKGSREPWGRHRRQGRGCEASRSFFPTTTMRSARGHLWRLFTLQRQYNGHWEQA